MAGQSLNSLVAAHQRVMTICQHAVEGTGSHYRFDSYEPAVDLAEAYDGSSLVGGPIVNQTAV
jgi:hypothetical protein